MERLSSSSGHLKYVFRAQPSGRQLGLASTGFVDAYSQEKFGKAPKDLRIAIIHEDGAYGVDVSKGVAVLPLPPSSPYAK